MLHRDRKGTQLGSDLPFELIPRKSYVIACPTCSDNRHKKGTRSLSVYRDDDGMIRYYCHHPGCEWNLWQSSQDPDPGNFRVVETPAVMPVPEDIQVPSDYSGDTLYWYRDIEGRYLFANRRINLTTGKLYVPFVYTSDGFMTGKGTKWPENYKGLYGAETIPNKEKAIVVEGEKAADAAKKLFPKHAVVSWLGGASNINKADWDLLRDIGSVLLWPDNDDDGRKVMRQISQLLPVGKILIAKVDHLSKGADLADELSNEDIATAITKAYEVGTKLEGVFSIEDIEGQIQDTRPARTTGYEVFDATTKLPGSGLVVVEGRTKHGKSALAVALTSNMLTSGLERAVTFYSYEMTAAKVFIRYLKTVNTKIDITNYKESKEFEMFSSLVSNNNLRIVDQSAQLSIADIVLAINKPQMRDSIVVLDYLQIIPASSMGGRMSRQLMLKEMLDAIRVNAHKNNVLVFVLSQLTPDYLNPQNDSPREAKDIHYSADLVLRVWNKAVGEDHPRYKALPGNYLIHTYLNREGESNVLFEGALEAGSKLTIKRRVRDSK